MSLIDDYRYYNVAPSSPPLLLFLHVPARTRFVAVSVRQCLRDAYDDAHAHA